MLRSEQLDASSCSRPTSTDRRRPADPAPARRPARTTLARQFGHPGRGDAMAENEDCHRIAAGGQPHRRGTADARRRDHPAPPVLAGEPAALQPEEGVPEPKFACSCSRERRRRHAAQPGHRRDRVDPGRARRGRGRLRLLWRALPLDPVDAARPSCSRTASRRPASSCTGARRPPPGPGCKCRRPPLGWPSCFSAWLAAACCCSFRWRRRRAVAELHEDRRA